MDLNDHSKIFTLLPLFFNASLVKTEGGEIKKITWCRHDLQLNGDASRHLMTPKWRRSIIVPFIIEKVVEPTRS
jgi:hypothetical protein